MKDDRLLVSLAVGFIILLLIIGCLTLDWTSLFNVVTGLSTLGATLLVLFTLAEMRTQRKAMYQPMVVVKTGNPVNIYWNNEAKCARSYIVTEEALERPDFSKDDTSQETSISTYNIGMGAAKHIKISWSFDPDVILETLNNYENLRINMTGKYLDIDYKGGRVMYALEKQLETRIDYILPTSIYPEPTRIQIPSHWLTLFAFYWYFLMKSKKDFETALNSGGGFKFPPLNMRMTYEDIGNNEHLRDFQINLDVILLTRAEDSIQKVSAYLEVSEMSAQ